MSRRHLIIALLVGALVIGVDQSTKWWALTTLRLLGGHIALSAPVDLTFNWNESNAFGLIPVIGRATRWVLMSANLIVAAFLLHAVLTRRLRPLTCLGLVLIMAGAVGNALDRLFYGAVVDFVDATKLGFPWIFNIADATLDVGIGLVIWSTTLNSPRAHVNEPT
jgi:signal peptidase II